jgi:hypothetical protein
LYFVQFRSCLWCSHLPWQESCYLTLCVFRTTNIKTAELICKFPDKIVWNNLLMVSLDPNFMKDKCDWDNTKQSPNSDIIDLTDISTDITSCLYKLVDIFVLDYALTTHIRIQRRTYTNCIQSQENPAVAGRRYWHRRTWKI